MNHNDYYKRLSTLVPLNTLRRHQFDQVFAAVEFLRFPEGTILFRQGDVDPDSLYLLEGHIELSADDGKRPNTIHSDRHESVYSIAQLSPRRFTGRALTDALIARVPHVPLERALAIEQVVGGGWATADDVLVEEGEPDEDIQDSDTSWTRNLLSSPIFQRFRWPTWGSCWPAWRRYPSLIGR